MKARRAGESAHLLLEVSGVLAVNNVEYAVIGAMAAAVEATVACALASADDPRIPWKHMAMTGPSATPRASSRL